MGFVDWAEAAIKELIIYAGLCFLILVCFISWIVLSGHGSAAGVIFFFIAIILFVYLLYRWNTHKARAEERMQMSDIKKKAYSEEKGRVEARRESDPLKALKMRYVNGELSEKDYQRMKTQLES